MTTILVEIEDPVPPIEVDFVDNTFEIDVENEAVGFKGDKGDKGDKGADGTYEEPPIDLLILFDNALA